MGYLSRLNLRRYAMHLKHSNGARYRNAPWLTERVIGRAVHLPLHFRFDYEDWYDVWDFKMEYYDDILFDDIEMPLASIRIQCEHLVIHFQLKLIGRLITGPGRLRQEDCHIRGSASRV